MIFMKEREFISNKKFYVFRMIEFKMVYMMKNIISKRKKTYIVAQVLVLLMGGVFLYKIRDYLFLLFILIIRLPFMLYLQMDTNVTNQPDLQDVVRRHFELKEDVFLYQRTADGLGIELPGLGSVLPISVDDYLRYGDRWDRSEAYVKYTDNEPDMFFKYKVVGILTKGTKIRIVQVHRKYSPLEGYYLEPTVEVLNNSYKGAKSHLSRRFFDLNKTKSSISLVIEDKYLQMCDSGLCLPLIEEVKTNPHAVEWVDRVDW